MRTHLMFSYGMNTNREQMSWRCPKAQSLGMAELPGYELAFRTHADITVTPESGMEGVLWKITDDCLAALDQLEGYPTYYTRYEVDVFHDNKWKKALVYKMNHGELEMPSASYLRMLVEGYSEHGCDLGQLYDAIDAAERHWMSTNKLELSYPYNPINEVQYEPYF